MSNWTRAHDAWIARECEGLEVEKFTHRSGVEDYGVKTSHMPMRHPSQAYTSISRYLTDPAAAIRAAEAWRKKDKDIDRTVTLYSAVERIGLPFRAELSENYHVNERYEWLTFRGESDMDYWPAVAQALLRATGGPE